MFKKEEFQARRLALQAQLNPKSMMILMAKPHPFRNADTHYPYRPDSNFFYMTGCEEPEAALLLFSKDLGGRALFFNRPRDPSLERWMGFMLGQEGAKEQLGFEETYPIAELNTQLPELLQRVDAVYGPWGQSEAWDNLVFRMQAELKKKVRRGVTWPREFIDVQNLIDEMRVIKSEAEIAAIRYAVNTSVKAHQEVMKYSRPGLYEYQIEACFVYHSGLNNCRYQAYSPIVANGANACILHYEQNSEPLQEGDLLLIDAGAEKNYYASDITRTFPVNGKFSEAQKLIYELVLEAQLAGIESIRPGVVWNQTQQVMLKILTEGLVELGLLKGSVDSLIESKAYLQFYMHGSGHFLGLDVHDAGTYKKAEQWRCYEVGMVLTVEPGLYIDADDLSVDPRWRGIGIRIEDDIVVTKTGAEVLSQNLIKTVADIEAWMAA